MLSTGRIVLPVYTQLEGPRLAARKPVVKRGGGEYSNGWIHWASFSFVFFSRHASADVETVTGELAAFAIFLRNEQRQDGWWVVGLWLVMAAT